MSARSKSFAAAPVTLNDSEPSLVRAAAACTSPPEMSHHTSGAALRHPALAVRFGRISIMQVPVPRQLNDNCAIAPERLEWLHALPQEIQRLERRWSITIGPPFPNATCALVAPVLRTDGTSAVLKIGMPHMEAQHEAEGLRFWDGGGTVMLLAATGNGT